MHYNCTHIILYSSIIKKNWVHWEHIIIILNWNNHNVFKYNHNLGQPYLGYEPHTKNNVNLKINLWEKPLWEAPGSLLEAAANTACHVVYWTIIYFAAGAGCARRAISIVFLTIRFKFCLPNLAKWKIGCKILIIYKNISYVQIRLPI